MATLRDIRRRIRSVENTQQITRAMQMVAAAKLHRAQDRVISSRPYAVAMTEMLQHLAGAAAELRHPLFQVREASRRTCVVISSDKGLCGAFNTNVFRHAELSVPAALQATIDLIPMGKRACAYFGKRGWACSYRDPELGDQASESKAQALAQHLTGLYERGETDRVDLIYTRFLTMGSRTVMQETLLPVTPGAPGVASPSEYIFEPNAEALFSNLLPRYVEMRVFTAFANSLASEHSARLVSMTAATKNAGGMITTLTLIRNKLRQAAITKEISELVGGAEALK